MASGKEAMEEGPWGEGACQFLLSSDRGEQPRGPGVSAEKDTQIGSFLSRSAGIKRTWDRAWVRVCPPPWTRAWLAGEHSVVPDRRCGPGASRDVKLGGKVYERDLSRS